MKKSQQEWVIDQLLKKGKISRNFALKHFVSRLGAIIQVLEENGWQFNAYYVKGDNGGRNYVYEMIKCPYKQQVYKVDGKIITKILKN
jgi:hypothetical protein